MSSKIQFKTQSIIGKIGVMLIGMGGNNGTTCIAGCLANKLGITWETKQGIRTANYFGSLMFSSTTRIGNDPLGNPVHVPLRNLVPMLHPDDIFWGGWYVCKVYLYGRKQ